MLEDLLDNVAEHVIQNHGNRHRGLEFFGELDEAEFLVEFGDEFGRAGERDSGYADETPIHSFVLTDGFAEGAALVVYGEGGDLLD